MPRILRIRNVSEKEAIQIKKLASSKTQPANLIQPAKVIQLLLDNPKMFVKDAAVLVGFKSPQQAGTWVKRFNENGINGLKDKQRSGRSPIHSQNTHSCLIDTEAQFTWLSICTMDTRKTPDSFQRKKWDTPFRFHYLGMAF